MFFIRQRKIQRAAKAALQSPQSFSSAMQVPLGGLGGLRARGIRGLGPPLPQGFVATFKSLVTFVSGKTFVPLFLCVFLIEHRVYNSLYLLIT